MNATHCRSRVPWPVVFALGLASCMGANGAKWTELAPRPADPSQVMSFPGTVHHLELEGGLYVIRVAQGTQYQPTNLPAAFQRDGMAVEVQARSRDDMASTGMAGRLIELIRIRERSAGASAGAGLEGSAWRLEDLAGTSVVAGEAPTLEFTRDGQARGNTSCNQFHGAVTITGESIAFGPLATTRRACPEAVMEQEKRFLDLLAGAKQLEMKEGSLWIRGDGSQALRFVRVR